MSERLFNRRMQWALGALLVALGLCIARLAYLQLWNYSKYAAEAQVSLTNEELVPSTRGRILDASGTNVLAEDSPSFDISVRVKDLKLTEVVLRDVRTYYLNRKAGAEPYLKAAREKEKAVASFDERIAALSAGGADAEAELRVTQDEKKKAVAELDASLVKLAGDYRVAEDEFRRQRDGAIARLAAREPMVAELSEVSGVPRETLARGLMNALEHVAKSYEGAPPPVAVNLDRKCWDRLYLRQRSALMAGKDPFPGVFLTNGVRRNYPKPHGVLACHVLGYLQPMGQDIYEGLAAAPLDRKSLRGEDAKYMDGLLKRLKSHNLGAPEPEGLVFLRPFGTLPDERFYFKTSEGERTWLRPRGSQKVGRSLPDERIGAYGVEMTHNQELRGEHSYRVSVRGVEGEGWGGGVRVKDYLTNSPPRPGQDVRLTIDLAVQLAAEKALAEIGKPGAVVFLDPQSGGILAMASYPTFDPDIFAMRRNEEITDYFEDKQKPMLCRAYQSAYPPGSTFKPIISSGALEDGLISSSTCFTCTHVLELGKAKFECLGSHGTIDFNTAMRKSCNLYFYHTGMKSGGERISRWARNLGYGAPTGVDLPGETGGFMPSPAWLKQVKRESWTDGHSCNTAIGQGAVLVSPLQAAVAFGMIANGGKPIRPYVVASPSRQEFVEPVTPRLSPKTITSLHRALEGVVSDSGTARLAQLKTVKVAGKTGSAEHSPKGSQTHAWFCGYAPADNPDPTVAFAVVIECGGHGGATAAPVARKVLEVLFGKDDSTIAPTGEERD